MRVRSHGVLIAIALLFTTSAHADKAKRGSVVARVVGIEIVGDSVIVTVSSGSERGIDKRAKARFREGKTTKLLADGDAMIIRIDKRSAILKTALPAEKVRANRFVQFDQ